MAVFAAISGSSLAAAATMGMVALPEMKRFKYDHALATGCVAAGGTLGILIPPSTVMIIYGISDRTTHCHVIYCRDSAGFIADRALHIDRLYCDQNKAEPGPSRSQIQYEREDLFPERHLEYFLSFLIGHRWALYGLVYAHRSGRSGCLRGVCDYPNQKATDLGQSEGLAGADSAGRPRWCF